VEELPKPDVLIWAAMRATGAETDDDLSFELRNRYGVKAGQSSINRWRNLKREPSYESTMTLLLAAGWLNEAEVRKAERDAARVQSAAAGQAAENLQGSREESARARRRSA
jgi:hypothetical protein